MTEVAAFLTRPSVGGYLHGRSVRPVRAKGHRVRDSDRAHATSPAQILGLEIAP
jgi:hypothetical protein